MFKSINSVIRTLIFSDIFLNIGWGFLAPVFAIFIVQKIALGNIAKGAEIAGFASLIYWFVKSSLQIPIGNYLDRNHGEKDDFWFMVLGLSLAGLVPFGFIIVSQPWHVYILQVFHAVGMAMVVPSWSAIFTRHIDKGREAFEWSLDSTALGFGIGIAGAVGGISAAIFGFEIIFALVGVFTFFSVGLLFITRKEIAPRDKIVSRFSPFKDSF